MVIGIFVRLFCCYVWTTKSLFKWYNKSIGKVIVLHCKPTAVFLSHLAVCCFGCCFLEPWCSGKCVLLEHGAGQSQSSCWHFRLIYCSRSEKWDYGIILSHQCPRDTGLDCLTLCDSVTKAWLSRSCTQLFSSVDPHKFVSKWELGICGKVTFWSENASTALVASCKAVVEVLCFP